VLSLAVTRCGQVKSLVKGFKGGAVVEKEFQQKPDNVIPGFRIDG
jgi:hypothetical protein